MLRHVARVLVVGGGLGAVFAASVLLPSAVVAAALVAILVWWMTRCRHAQPLALLPPLVNERGERLPARWYCDDCGKSWPAVFERAR